MFVTICFGKWIQEPLFSMWIIYWHNSWCSWTVGVTQMTCMRLPLDCLHAKFYIDCVHCKVTKSIFCKCCNKEGSGYSNFKYWMRNKWVKTVFHWHILPLKGCGRRILWTMNLLLRPLHILVSKSTQCSTVMFRLNCYVVVTYLFISCMLDYCYW